MPKIFQFSKNLPVWNPLQPKKSYLTFTDSKNFHFQIYGLEKNLFQPSQTTKKSKNHSIVQKKISKITHRQPWKNFQTTTRLPRRFSGIKTKIFSRTQNKKVHVFQRSACYPEKVRFVLHGSWKYLSENKSAGWMILYPVGQSLIILIISYIASLLYRYFDLHDIVYLWSTIDNNPDTGCIWL